MNRRGFTLLELTLAMGMSAMLALSLYAALSGAFRARRSATAAVEPARAASIIADLIAQDLQSVPPPTGTLRGPFLGTHQSSGGGDADTVEFCCVGRDPEMGDSPLAEGMRKVDLVLRTDLNPPVLVRRVTRNLLAPSDPAPEEQLLCRNVRSFSVRYFDGLTWQQEWDSTTVDNVLPAAVSITLQIENPSATSADSPPLTIRRVIPLACAKPAQTGAQ